MSVSTYTRDRESVAFPGLFTFRPKLHVSNKNKEVTEVVLSRTEGADSYELTFIPILTQIEVLIIRWS